MIRQRTFHATILGLAGLVHIMLLTENPMTRLVIYITSCVRVCLYSLSSIALKLNMEMSVCAM
jgi:hypothetical protein